MTVDSHGCDAAATCLVCGHSMNFILEKQTLVRLLSPNTPIFYSAFVSRLALSQIYCVTAW